MRKPDLEGVEIRYASRMTNSVNGNPRFKVWTHLNGKSAFYDE